LKRNKCEKDMPTPKPRYPKKPSVISQIEKELKKGDSNLEFAFIKAPKEKIKPVYANQFKTKVIIDEKKIEKYLADILRRKYKEAKKIEKYKTWLKYIKKEKSLNEIHTHYFTENILPSTRDIVRLFLKSQYGTKKISSTTLQNNNGKIEGRLQYVVDPKKIPPDFREKLIELNKKLIKAKKSENLSLYLELYNSIIDYVKKYRSKIITKIQTDSYSGKIKDPETNADYHIQSFNKMGLIIHFIPNEGYLFDKDKIKFIKK